jgi:hypothetical protein
MRQLVVISSKLYVRDFLSAGAFDAIDGEDTYYAVGPETADDDLARHPRCVGVIDMPRERREAYGRVRQRLMTSYRHRSRTAKIKLSQLPARQQAAMRAEAAPGVRQLLNGRDLGRIGVNPSYERVLDELRPDLVITPSNGLDAHTADGVRSARPRGITTLALMYNWDNLSSKAAFTAAPDYLGVGGFQGAEHAERIHGVPRDRIGVIGSPYIDGHFRHVLGSTTSPFDFPYVLFAGCYQPYDELTALRALEDEIEREGLGLKVVYLPHPKRLARRNDDFVDESTFRHVVIHPAVKEDYVALHGADKALLPRPLPLDAYPALIENAVFTVCPLSTMMLEAAIFGQRVLVIAHHDGIHPTSPGVAVDYLHFDGVDRVENFTISREQSDLGPLFGQLARGSWTPARPPKERMDYWVFHDERPFSRRLADFVGEIATARTPRS